MQHTFIGTGEGNYVRCLSCGGMWTLAGDGRAPGEYAQSFDGHMASDCRGLYTATDGGGRCHHYAGECPVSECSLDGECNCLFCKS